jgi:hypothetical protein
MAKAFFTSRGRARAVASIRRSSSGVVQSIDAAVPDGDTAGTHIEGSASVRFLGIDTAEKNFSVPGGGKTKLDSDDWEAYLADPFRTAVGGTFGLDDELLENLRPRVGAGAGANHRRHGENGETSLQTMITQDMAILGQDAESFAFFLAFSFEVFDTFGRFLCFINRNQPSADDPEPRPLSYNERQLETGAALPYLIWPNIDPFRGNESILDAVIQPGTANDVAETGALKRARDLVKAARVAEMGVFDAADPLRLEAFELRYLSRRRPPSRAVIDLSQNGDTILQPMSYHQIPNPEDRLFIPGEYVPLFASRGWRLEGWG